MDMRGPFEFFYLLEGFGSGVAMLIAIIVTVTLASRRPDRRTEVRVVGTIITLFFAVPTMWGLQAFGAMQLEDKLCASVLDKDHRSVEAMLKNGVDPNTCVMGDTGAYDLAKQNHDEKMLALLEKYRVRD